MRYAVVGGGIAGVTIAEELRRGAPEAGVVVFNAEPNPLYSRMLLKEFLKGGSDEAAVRIHDEAWFERNGIDYHGGVRVVGTREGRVLTDSGEEVPYDVLFAAGGGSQADPFGITEEAENVRGLWSFRDARWIRQRVERGEIETAVVVGAGFLGLELADALAVHGVHTHYVMRGRWSRHGMGPAGSEIVHHALGDHGVTVQEGQRVVDFETEAGEVVAVRTDQRVLPCDFVGLAVGLTPNVDYLGGTDAEVRDGVVVDEHMRSADPNVLAAGDVAEYYDPVLERHRRTGTWLSAIDQGRVAAATALGEEARFDRVEAHSVAVDGLDAPVVFLGDWEDGDEAVERCYGETRYRRVALRDGRPVGATMIGESGDVVGQLRRLIREGPRLDGKARAGLLDPCIGADTLRARAPT